MSLNSDNRYVNALLRMILEPLYKHNPYFMLYYNPLLDPPQPQVTSKPYYNYIHQVSLLLDMIPRARVRVLIGDEVGLGKTVEAIRIVKYLIATGQAKKILIIAPRMLIKQWIYHDIRDLLYSPRRIRRVTRKNIDEILDSIYRGVDSTVVYLAPVDLIKRGRSDKHARGYFKPYYDFVSSVKWDLLVVDEAHQLGFTRSKSTLRTERLTPICINAKHLVLLSATPSRGTHEDMLGRISLLYPELRGRIRIISREENLRRKLYGVLSDYVVYRRSKDYVNTLEGKQVFTKLSSLMALIKLGDKARLYEDLNKTISLVLKSIDANAPGLVKIIILKRALSSPYAFLKTMKKVLSEETQETGGGLRKVISERFLENSVDEVVEGILRSIAKKIPVESRLEVYRLVGAFEEIYKEGDPGFKALAHLLYSVLTNPKLLPRELVGDYVVFSEYRDTVEYIYDKLIDFFKTRGFKPDDHRKKLIIETTVRKYYEKRYSEPISKRYISLLHSSMNILVDEGGNKGIFIAKLSSLNQDIIHLIPELVESLKDIVKGDVLRVLVSTDIASEGLNLHQFNIVVNYDVPWSPIRREQRIGRVYRLRQTRDCTVLDFIRDVVVEYEFYTKLVLKLLNMAEQRIASKPLEGVIELYITRRHGSGEEYLQISETDIATALCRVYEDYYIRGKYVSEVLSNISRELAEKLRKHRDLAEDLMPSYVAIESTRNYAKELTGCRNHDHFINALCSIYSVVTGGLCSEASKMLVNIYEKISADKFTSIDPEVAILVREPGVEKGYLGIVDFVVENNTRYSTPILFLYRNGKVELKHGVELIEWLAEGLKKGTIGFTKISMETTKGDEAEFRELVNSFTNKLNLLFTERIGVKSRDLARITGSALHDLKRIEPALRGVLIKVLGVQSIEEYEEYLTTLPEEIKFNMEKESVEYVKELFEKKNCRIIEVNIGVYKPYDLLVECIENSRFVKYMVEVKSHLKRILVAELTPGETNLAEENPDNYIVCNVAGLENPDKSSWIVLCDVYKKLKKELVTKTKEEKIAVLYFT